MKIKTLAGLLLLVITFLVGSYTSQDAKAQVAYPAHPALKYMSVVMLDDGTGNMVPTVQFTGANVRIVNGLGATQCSLFYQEHNKVVCIHNVSTPLFSLYSTYLV